MLDIVETIEIHYVISFSKRLLKQESLFLFLKGPQVCLQLIYIYLQ